MFLKKNILFFTLGILVSYIYLNNFHSNIPGEKNFDKIASNNIVNNFSNKFGGNIDSFELINGDLYIDGWAVDFDKKKPTIILVYLEDILLHVQETNKYRKDLVDTRNIKLGFNGGFSLVLSEITDFILACKINIYSKQNNLFYKISNPFCKI